jgi:hypothetical protein
MSLTRVTHEPNAAAHHIRARAASPMCVYACVRVPLGILAFGGLGMLPPPPQTHTPGADEYVFNGGADQCGTQSGVLLAPPAPVCTHSGFRV